jgi:beta-lactamase regulating signal transducer with metallopeptidase domain
LLAWLAHNTLGALPLALVALGLRLLPRVPPTLEHLFWLLVAVRLVLPPFPGATLPAWLGGGPLALGAEEVAAWWSGELALASFSAAVVFVLARELGRARAVARCVRRSAEAHPELVERVAGVAARLGVRVPRVRVSPDVARPFVWGLERPVLVLAASEPAPSPALLAHGLAHLRRREHWTSWLVLVVQGLHFWNPLFWMARRHLRRAAALACDRWALHRYPSERREFAAALLAAAESAPASPFVPRAVQAIGLADPRDCDERLLRILGEEEREGAPSGLFAAAALALAASTQPAVGGPVLDAFAALWRGLASVLSGS